MQLLDTAALPIEQRVEAFRAAFDQASVPCRIEHLGPASGVESRMHLWEYGRANLFSTDSSGFRLVRTTRHVRMAGPPVVALAVQVDGIGEFSQFGVDQRIGTGRLMVSDLTAPYTFSWAGAGGSRAFQIPYDQLGLAPEVIRTAAPRVRRSPLHDLVRLHLRRVAADADRLADDAAATALGTATTELVRALLVSVGSAGRRVTRDVREDTLLTRALTWARQHLTDPDLDAEGIAAAHNVSVRQLYKVCAAGGVSLEQWLIAERLELARAELVSPSGRHRSIAAVALGCGFADPSHFARRFRAAYGLSPRECRLAR
jgi:AraC-like DNA-binding protein